MSSSRPKSPTKRHLEDEDQTSRPGSPTKKAKTSAVWEHYSEQGDGTRSCFYCTQTYSKSSGTTTLQNHLDHHHPNRLPVKPSQRTLDTMQGVIMSATQKERVDKAMIEWIVVNFQPFMVVEDDFFRAFCAVLNPSYKPICRETVSNRVKDGFPEVKRAITQFLASAPSSGITCTTDGWSSVALDSYTAVTAHYISENWELQGMLIDFVLADESHTGDNISGKL